MGTYSGDGDEWSWRWDGNKMVEMGRRWVQNILLCHPLEATNDTFIGNKTLQQKSLSITHPQFLSFSPAQKLRSDSVNRLCSVPPAKHRHLMLSQFCTTDWAFNESDHNTQNCHTIHVICMEKNYNLCSDTINTPHKDDKLL